MEMVPVLNLVGSAINLAMLGTRVAVAAHRYTEAQSAPTEQPPAEMAPSPALSPGPAVAKAPAPPGLFSPIPDKRSGSMFGGGLGPFHPTETGVSLTVFTFK
jgi:hypothetical protein